MAAPVLCFLYAFKNKKNPYFLMASPNEMGKIQALHQQHKTCGTFISFKMTFVDLDTKEEQKICKTFYTNGILEKSTIIPLTERKRSNEQPRKLFLFINHNGPFKSY